MCSVGKCSAFLSRDLWNRVELVSRALSHQRIKLATSCDALTRLELEESKFSNNLFFSNIFSHLCVWLVSNFCIVSVFYLGIIFGRINYGATIWMCWVNLMLLVVVNQISCIQKMALNKLIKISLVMIYNKNIWLLHDLTK